MSKIAITTQGYEKLEQEHKKLKFEDRPAIIDAISEARSHGDLKENAEYHAAKEKQSFLEGRIQELENIIANAEIIDVSKFTGDRIVFGATVELIDDETEEKKKYQIVSEYEADIENHKISVTSPIARALIGKEEGDMVIVQTPGGKRKYEVTKVSYKA